MIWSNVVTKSCSRIARPVVSCVCHCSQLFNNNINMFVQVISIALYPWIITCLGVVKNFFGVLPQASFIYSFST